MDSSQTFPAHKSILIGRSHVFATMLKSGDMDEEKRSSLVIKDIKPDALKEMLRFLYTDEVNTFTIRQFLSTSIHLMHPLKSHGLPQLFKSGTRLP